MIDADDQEYYIMRAAICRSLQLRAASPVVAAIHADLASRYEQLAVQPGRNDTAMVTAVQPV